MKLRFIIPLACLAAAFPSQGQNLTDPSLLSAVGTAHISGPDAWAYLLWQPSDAEDAQGLVYAIYRKNGDASSGSPFSRVAVTQPQTDDRTVGSLIARSTQLGQDVMGLDHTLTALFQDFIPAPSVSTAVKLAAVVHGTLNDPEQQEALAFLAKCQPLAAMALGQAVADKLPALGIYTYEIREFDTAASEDVRVLGRVTVDTASGVQLPAPGGPLQVQRPDDQKQEGHLSIHLRWATPDALRERSPMQSGYNVYRVKKTFAVDSSRKWQVTPPSAADLIAGVNAGLGDVVRVNEGPVFPDELLDAVEAADAGDRETYFVTDDNRRFEQGGVPLANGDEFYYFVTALDILCRDGAVSTGTLATACDCLAPPPPLDVHVSNEVAFDGTNRIQRLAVRWPAANDPDSAIASYEVFRWTSLEEIQEFRTDPIPRRIAVIPSVPTQDEYVYLDNAPDSPRHPPAPGDPDLSGTLFFYTIRATDSSACGGNTSLHSPPARGILRASEGPAAPTGDVLVTCYDPALQFTNVSSEAVDGLSETAYHFKLLCGAVPEMFEWAEFRYRTGLSVVVHEFLGRAYFGREGAASQVAFINATRDDWPDDLEIECRAATRGGKITPWVSAVVPKPPKPDGDRLILLWLATVQEMTDVAGGPIGTDHCSIQPGTGDRNNPRVAVAPTPGSRELRIYRRVDDGPLTLVWVQELDDDTTPVIFDEGSTPSGVAGVCYFAQLLDENGLASPMTPLGPCIRVVGDSEMPVPVLLRPEAITVGGNARMRVSWSCPPFGIERFELWVARRNRSPLGAWPGSGLSANLVQDPPLRHPNRATRDFGVYQTALVAGLPSEEEGTVFTFDLPVTNGERYDLVVRAVGRGDFASGRPTGAFSNFEDFAWSAAEVADPVNVPWPARPLPPTSNATDYHSEIQAVYLNTLASGLPPWKGVGVRIGAYEYRGENSTFIKGGNVGPTSAMPAYYIPEHVDPQAYLFQKPAPDDAPVNTLWPLALFRVQIPNATKPVVSYDTSQVSPLMDQIAFVHGIEPGTSLPATIIHDPFIGVKPKPAPPPAGNNYDIFLLDRNPVIRGASYQYLLVRYGPGMEIEEVLATNTVIIP